jgi:hypothetical protein
MMQNRQGAHRDWTSPLLSICLHHQSQGCDDDDDVNDDDMTPGWSPSRPTTRHVSKQVLRNHSIYVENHPDDIDDDGCR